MLIVNIINEDYVWTNILTLKDIHRFPERYQWMEIVWFDRYCEKYPEDSLEALSWLAEFHLSRIQQNYASRTFVVSWFLSTCLVDSYTRILEWSESMEDFFVNSASRRSSSTMRTRESIRDWIVRMKTSSWWHILTEDIVWIVMMENETLRILFTKSNKHWSWTVSDKVSNFGGSEIGIFIITCMNRHTEMIMFTFIESASEWWTWSSAASSTHVSSWMRISWVQESDGKNLLMVVQWHCGTCVFPLSDG